MLVVVVMTTTAVMVKWREVTTILYPTTIALFLNIPVQGTSHNFSPQTSAGTGQGNSRHNNRMGEVATKTNAMGMGIMLPTSPIVYSSKGDYRFGDSLTERGPILLDVPNGQNELVIVF